MKCVVIRVLVEEFFWISVIVFEEKFDVFFFELCVVVGVVFKESVVWFDVEVL